VLPVNDEDSVRNLTRHVLAGGGCAVPEAARGEDSLALSRRQPGPVE
jgi:hypothetical protein